MTSSSSNNLGLVASARASSRRFRSGSVRLLGHEGELNWAQTDEGLTISLPGTVPSSHALAFAVTR